jgi:hypothetical protein
LRTNRALSNENAKAETLAATSSAQTRRLTLPDFRRKLAPNKNHGKHQSQVADCRKAE